MSAVLEAGDLARNYAVSRGAFRQPAIVKALAGATFSLEAGKTLAVVGESGCGKSTLARLVTMIEPPSDGHARHRRRRRRRTPTAASSSALRSTVQIVFQDPYGSLNPRQKVGTILEEPLVINTQLDAAERRAKALDDAGAASGLRPEHYGRYPHMFSGGQRQRIAIARALMLRAEDPGARRAGLGARRVDPGADPEPPRRPAGRSSASPISSSATISRSCASSPTR